MSWSASDIALPATIAVLIGYPVAMRLIAKAVHNDRMAMVDTANAALSSPYLSDRAKLRIRRLIDVAMDSRLMPGLLIVLPSVIVGRAVGHRDPQAGERMDQAEQEVFDRFMRLFLRSSAAANPIFALLVLIEIAVLGLVLIPLGKMRQLTRMVYTAISQADERWLHRA